MNKKILSGLMHSAAQVGGIAAVGIDSWAVDFGLIDRSGSLIDQPRHYRDEHHAKAMQVVVERIGTHRCSALAHGYVSGFFSLVYDHGVSRLI